MCRDDMRGVSTHFCAMHARARILLLKGINEMSGDYPCALPIFSTIFSKVETVV